MTRTITIISWSKLGRGYILVNSNPKKITTSNTVCIYTTCNICLIETTLHNTTGEESWWYPFVVCMIMQISDQKHFWVGAEPLENEVVNITDDSMVVSIII